MHSAFGLLGSALLLLCPNGADAQGGDPGCPPGNLLAGRTPVWSVAVQDAAALTDGAAVEEGANPEAHASARFTLHLGGVVYDFGQPRPIRSARLQAAHEDAYELAVSDDGVRWRPLWRPGPARESGARTRSRDDLEATVRYVRLDPIGGRAPFHATELQLFCGEATPWSTRAGSAPSRAMDRIRGSRGVAVLPLVLALLAGAGAAWLARRQGVVFRGGIQPEATRWRSLAATLVVLAACLSLLTLRSYGFNIDEYYQMDHGIRLVDWYAGLLSSGTFREFETPWQFMRYYGGAFETLAELAARVSSMDRVTTRHLVNALVGLLALVATYGLGATVHSRAAGCFAVLVLLLTPRYYGHIFTNPKDVPFAAAYAFALLCLCRAIPSFPRVPGRWILALGIATGLILGIRVGGSFFFGIFGLACALWLAMRRLREGASRPELLRDAGVLGSRAVAVVAVAWLVMLACWPWAQLEPLSRPLRAIFFLGDIPGGANVDFDVFFEGEVFTLRTVPWHFTLKWLLIAVPEFYWLGLLGAIGWRRARPPSGRRDTRVLSGVVVALAVLAPLGLLIATGTIQFDGIRHVLFILPPLAALVGTGLAAFLDSATAAPLKIGAAVTAGVALSVTAFDMARLHPYEYVYFNRSFGGGLGAAAERFETDYLGLSYKEGTAWVVENHPHSAARQTRVAACPGFRPNLVQGLLGHPANTTRITVVEPWEKPDLMLIMTRAQCHLFLQGRVLETVSRDGIPLLYVIERRQGRPAVR